MGEIENLVRVRTVKAEGDFSIDIVRRGRVVAIRYEEDRDTEVAFESTAIDFVIDALLAFKAEIREAH